MSAFKVGDRVKRIRSTGWGDADDLVGGQVYTVRAVQEASIMLEEAYDDTFTYNSSEFELAEIPAGVGGRVRITIEAEIERIAELATRYADTNGERYYSDSLLAAGATIEVIEAPKPKPTAGDVMRGLAPGTLVKIEGFRAFTYVIQADERLVILGAGGIPLKTETIAEGGWDTASHKVTVLA